MENFGVNWLTERWDDEEIPRYLLMQYVQNADLSLKQLRLFPLWEEVYHTYTKLKLVKLNLEMLKDVGNRELIGWDYANMRWLKKNEVHPGKDEVKILQERLNFALPNLKWVCQFSEKVRAELDTEIVLDQFGVQLLYNKEGLLLTQRKNDPEIWSWYFKQGLQRNPNYEYSSIETRLIGRYTCSLAQTIYHIRNKSLEKIGLASAALNSWIAAAPENVPHTSAIKPVAILKLAKAIKEGL